MFFIESVHVSLKHLGLIDLNQSWLDFILLQQAGRRIEALQKLSKFDLNPIDYL